MLPAKFSSNLPSSCLLSSHSNSLWLNIPDGSFLLPHSFEQSYNHICPAMEQDGAWIPSSERLIEVFLSFMKFDESFVRSSSSIVPSSPPTIIGVVLFERSMVVLLAVVKLDELLVELFVNPLINRFPSLPPILIGDLLWAKKISANNTARINIARFIHSPLYLICAAA